MARSPAPAFAPRSAPAVSDDRAEARLTAIAGDHIRRYGLDRVTVTAVAREAGMSHANVYRFFPSKAGLIEAVVVAWLRSVEVTLSDISSGSDPADDKLERFLSAWARAQRDGLDRDAPIYAAYATFAAERRDAVMAHRTRVRTLLSGIVEDGMEPGPFRVRNLERAVSFVADAMQRFVHPTLVGETRDVPRSQVEARAAVVIRVTVRTLVNGSI